MSRPLPSPVPGGSSGDAEDLRQPSRPPRNPARRRTWSACFILALLPTLVTACDDGDTVDSSPVLIGDAGGAFDPTEEDGGSDDVDGGGHDQDTGELDTGEAPVDAGAESRADAAEGSPDSADPLRSCTTHEECSDGIYCNGQERCETENGASVGICRSNLVIACTPEHPCDEADSVARGVVTCKCDRPDLDGDGEAAVACGGHDCDDTRDWCSKGRGIETCDPLGLDEDCDSTTIQSADGDGDRDGDGYVADHCFNVDPISKKRRGGDDCDDANPHVAPHNPEVCNYRDDNCNKLVDEVLEADNKTYTPGGLRARYLPDLDGDGHADKSAEERLECDYLQPPGYVAITKVSADDCNDEPLKGAGVYPGALERCDTIDNDCDGFVDRDDPSLDREYTFPDTDVECIAGRWQITHCPPDMRWCPGDRIERGCGDETLLSRCRGCQTDCKFSCGRQGCNEVEQIGANSFHSCARTHEGTLACWGRGSYGRLGDDGVVSRAVPASVIGLAAVSDFALGTEHTCAIEGAGRQLWCWGHNDLGQAGGAELEIVPVPVRVTDTSGTQIRDIVSLDAGFAHTCLVNASGALTCFGSMLNGRLGNGRDGTGGGPTVARAPVSVLQLVYDDFFEEFTEIGVTNARSVSVGDNHGCALLRNGTVGCWGSNTLGQLGDGGSVTRSLTFQPVAGLTEVTKISVGDTHTCALAEGRVYCWGDNGSLQLGRARGADNSRPVALDLAETFSDVVAGRTFTCARTTAGRVGCWGSAFVLGFQRPGAAPSVQPVWLPLDGVRALSTQAGQEHVCALGQTGAFCWGENAHGQLGINAARQSETPVMISALRGSRR